MYRTANLPVPGAVAYHEQLAETWEERYKRASFQARLRVLAECLTDVDIKGQCWLDAGSGSGTLARYLAGRCARVLGLDGSTAMVRAGLRAAKEHHVENLEFRHVPSIADLPLSDQSFHGILCSSVLEYVPDVGACLAQFGRVLRPGGRLLVSVPNRRSMIRRFQVRAHCIARSLSREWISFLDYSRNEFSAQSFPRILDQFGFSTIKTVPFGGPVPQWFQRCEFGGSLLMFSALRKETT